MRYIVVITIHATVMNAEDGRLRHRTAKCGEIACQSKEEASAITNAINGALPSGSHMRAEVYVSIHNAGPGRTIISLDNLEQIIEEYTAPDETKRAAYA